MTRGRPREFDAYDALDQAQLVFARDGYDGASMHALTDAMGICKPSLYAAYGNKEALFIAVLQRYAAAADARRSSVLNDEPDGRRAVEQMLSDTVARYTQSTPSPGCLIVAQAAGGSTAAQSSGIRIALAAVMDDGRDALRARLSRARAEGDLPADVNIDALATYFSTVMAGLSVQARNGATAELLGAVVQSALCAWPIAVSA